MSKKLFPVFLLVVFMASIVAGCGPAATAEPTTAPAAPAAPEATAAPVEPTPTIAPTIRAGTPDRLVLATTTSTQDSGLLDYILPDFEAEFNTEVDVIAVGTGQSLQLGKDGNADVVLVHARSQEDAFMADGHGVRREDVMYNDFVIVGPESDPAGIKGMASAAEAMKKIADSQSAFVSRGDKSGTHTKELAVWKAAGIEPAGDWYISAGQGMGEVLTMAAEQQAYTLSDRATYLARTKTGLALEILVEKDSTLLNPYGVIAVNPDKGAMINADLATKFIDWIISVSVQEKIEGFGLEEFGQSLFVPDSTPWNEAQSSAPAASGATLKATGLVDAEATWTVDDIDVMDMMSVDYTNKDGETKTYEGVLISDLLEAAGVKADAQTVVFVAEDGFSAEMALADVMSCANCIVAVDDGIFRTVMPEQSGKLQVKGLVEIQAK